MKKVERASARRERERERHAAEVASRRPREGYEPCIVTFIDILGFRNLLNTRHAHDIRDALLHLRKFTAPEDDSPPRKTKDARLLSRAFADSVSDAVVRVRVFDTQYSDGALFNELLNLLIAQVRCLQNGIVIRAGLAIGDAHVGFAGRGPVFGPAMVRAYEIECNEAIYPRILIDAPAYEQFLTDVRLHKEGHGTDEEVRHVSRLLSVDADGKRFIDYLRASEGEFDYDAEYFEFLGQHAQLIRANLAITEANVRAKYEWMANYHNKVISEILSRFESGRLSAEDFENEYDTNPIELFRGLIVDH